MGATAKLNITLPEELARKVRSQVESGAFADESDVIRDALEARLDGDDRLERWLKEEVAPAVDAFRASPERTKSIEEVRRRLLGPTGFPGREKESH